MQKYGREVCGKTGDKCALDVPDKPPAFSPRASEVWRLWTLSQTQWRIGMDGPTGLDYAGVAVVSGAVGIPITDPVLRLIQKLENARLIFIDERRKEKEKAAKK